MPLFFANQRLGGAMVFGQQIGPLSVSVTPGAASLAIAGYAPTLAQTANQSLVPGATALALTGYAPALTQTGAQSLSPGAAALSITGFVPSVSQSGNLALSPSAAAITVTGFAPNLAQSTGLMLQPTPAGLSVTGHVPSITVGGEEGTSLITLAEAKQYLDMALSVAMPDFVVRAAIDKTVPFVPALAEAGYSAPDQQMIQCMAVALIAVGGNPRRLTSQSAPSGASRSFKLNGIDLQALRRALIALDPAGVMAEVVGPDPTSNTLFMVVC
jgi:hypothetical protein